MSTCTPSDVNAKVELYCRMFSRNSFARSSCPSYSSRIGAGGSGNRERQTTPLLQHSPNFGFLIDVAFSRSSIQCSAPQEGHGMLIDPRSSRWMGSRYGRRARGSSPWARPDGKPFNRLLTQRCRGTIPCLSDPFCSLIPELPCTE